MQMFRVRLTVRRMMIAVGVVGLECWLLREAILGDLAAIGMLLMANALGLGAYGVRNRSGRTRTFLAGFEIAGLASALAFLAAVWTFPGDVGGWLVWALVGPLENLRRTALPPGLVTGVMLTAVAIAIALPQLLIALAGGMLACSVARGPGNAVAD
jgi:hypothetical protein